MATATTKTTPASEIPDVAQQIREQLISAIRQGQQLSIDAAQGWVKAASVFPVSSISALPVVPGVPAVPGVEAATRFTFDVAADLLNAQRDFALSLANVLVTDTSA